MESTSSFVPDDDIAAHHPDNNDHPAAPLDDADDYNHDHNKVIRQDDKKAELTLAVADPIPSESTNLIDQGSPPVLSVPISSHVGDPLIPGNAGVSARPFYSLSPPTSSGSKLSLPLPPLFPPGPPPQSTEIGTAAASPREIDDESIVIASMPTTPVAKRKPGKRKKDPLSSAIPDLTDAGTPLTASPVTGDKKTPRKPSLHGTRTRTREKAAAFQETLGGLPLALAQTDDNYPASSSSFSSPSAAAALLQSPSSSSSPSSAPKTSFRPAKDEFIQNMRNSIVAHKATTATGHWLTHQEKLWELFNLEKKGSALTYVPVTLRHLPGFPPNRLPEPATILIAAAPLLANPAFSKFRESQGLSSLPQFVPNLAQVAPDIYSTLVPFQPSSAGTSLVPVSVPLIDESKATGKRKATDPEAPESVTGEDRAPSLVMSLPPTQASLIPLPVRPKVSFPELLASFKLIDEDDITPEELTRRAEAEADIHMRILRLKSQGMFFGRPVFKKPEPPVKKAHWDYLLQEVAIVADEMSKDRKLKSALGKRYARAVVKHFEDLGVKETKQEKEEEKRLKKIASNLARDVIRFWKKIEKVANLKKESKLKEIQSAAMDKHLDFIVGETEKYSVLLAEKLGGVAGIDSAGTSTPVVAAISSEPHREGFTPVPGESPKKDSSATPGKHTEAEELDQEEKVQPPSTLVVNVMSSLTDNMDASTSEKAGFDQVDENDTEFVPSAEQEEDDERTLDQEEGEANEEDNKNELDDLTADANIPLEDLLARYGIKVPATAQATAPTAETADSEDMNTSTSEASPKDIESEAEEEEDNEDSAPSAAATQPAVAAAGSPPTVAPASEQEPQASKDDEDYQMSEEEVDDETTIAQEEEGLPEENEAELNDLQRDAEMPIEELLRMYNLPAATYAPQPATKPRHEELDDFEMTRSGRRKRRRVEAEEGSLQISNPKAEQDPTTSSSVPPPSTPQAGDNSTNTETKGAEGREPEKGEVQEGQPETQGSTDSPEISSGESEYESDSEPEAEESEQLYTEDESEIEEEEAEAAGRSGRGKGGESRDSRDGTPGLEAIFGGIRDHPQDSTGFGEELENAASVGISLQPTGHTLSTTTITTKVPFLIKHQLREYQIVGLNWLVTMYEKNLNGILADEMGLGKTIQTISLLAHLAVEKQIWGPHLIVVPTAVLLNWEMECMKWCPAFKVLTYYGSIKERKAKRTGWNSPNAFHICITSYKLVMQDHIMFRRKKWQYLILDEAQHIKNFKSQRWQSLLHFNSERRLLLTGTPLQNNLMELWSLMHFLMPNIFESHKEFQEWFSNPVNNMIEGNDKINHKLIQRLHTVLRPFLLRRLKKDVEKQLPNKFEHVVYCRLSKRQSYLYDEFMSRSSTKETLASENILSILNCLMQLRKVCCHPDLFEVRPIVSPLLMEPLTLQVPTLALRALHVDPLSTFPHPTATPPPWVLDLAFLNLRFTDNAFSANNCQSHPNLAESLVKLSKFLEDSKTLSRTPLLTKLLEVFPDNGAEPNANPAIGSPATVLRSSFPLSLEDDQLLYSQAHRQRDLSEFSKYSPKLLQTLLSLGEGRKSEEVPAALSQMVLSPQRREQQMHDLIDTFVCVIPPVTSQTPRLSLARPRPYITEIHQIEKRISWELKGVDDVLHSSKVRMETFFPDKRLLQYDCGKLQKLDELLKQLKSGNHRVLIFSQMTKMLDIFEIFLSMHGYRYLRLDGTTKVEHRQQLIERFNSDPRYFVFILSTRSGGVGINLTGADTVIFYDSDWNPAMDAQAQDRCHRIGQTRDVHIYRLVTEHTIEENILRKANQKRLLDDVVIQGGAFTTEFFQKQMDWKNLFNQRGMTNEYHKGNAEAPADKGIDEDVAAGEETAGGSNSNTTTARGSREVLGLPKLTQAELELALTAVEDESDVQAMKQAKTEISLELADFDPDAPIGEPSGLDDTETTGLEREPSKQNVPQEDVIQADQPIPEVPLVPLGAVDQEFEAVLGPIERYALRFVETYYPAGLTDPTPAGKKPLPPPSSTPSAVKLTMESESGEATLVGESEGYVEAPFVFPETSQRVVQPIKGWRGGPRTRGVSKAKSGIIQTPGRRGGGGGVADYFLGKEPKTPKVKGKGKKRGRGGWRGRPRPGAAGEQTGRVETSLLSLDDDDEMREASGSGISTPFRGEEEDGEEEGMDQGENDHDLEAPSEGEDSEEM